MMVVALDRVMVPAMMRMMVEEMYAVVVSNTRWHDGMMMMVPVTALVARQTSSVRGSMSVGIESVLSLPSMYKKPVSYFTPSGTQMTM